MTRAARASGRFVLPPALRRTMPSGLRLIAMEYHKLPLVYLDVVIGSGAARDPAGKEGVASLTAHLLRKGAAGRSAQEIARSVDFAGGSLSAAAERDGSRVTAEFLVKDLDLALTLLTDVLMRPTLADQETERLKGEIIGELMALRENPGPLASRRIMEVLYRDHPYGHAAPGSESTVASLSAEDPRRYHAAHYVPENSFVVAVGDFDAGDMLDRLEASFSTWPSSGWVAPEPVPGPSAPEGRLVYLVDKPDATQSQIRIGGIGIRRTDPDHVPVQVANTILGGGFTSRLVQEIRVKRGLSYGASSRFYPMRREGPFIIGTFSKNETTIDAVRVSLDVLGTFRKDGATFEELDKALRYMKGTFALEHQSPESLADALTDIAFHGLPEDYYDGYLDRIDAVGLDDVARAAREKFPFERAVVLVLGRAESILKDLETLGPVTVVPIEASLTAS